MYDNSLSIDLLLSVAPYFQLHENECKLALLIVVCTQGSIFDDSFGVTIIDSCLYESFKSL